MRWEWLSGLISENGWTSGAEIGVKEGQTTFHLLGNNPALRMVAVDAWKPQPQSGEFGYMDWPHEEHEAAFRARAGAFEGRCQIMKMQSVEAASHIRGGSLDFVFLDGDHSTSALVMDIKAWLPKVKAGGLLAGHDVNWKSVRKALEILPGYGIAPDRCWFFEK
jgi:hypothetical protein